MVLWRMCGIVVIGCLLACSGAGLTPRGSEGAQRLCAWLEAEHDGAPCVTYGVGDDVTVGGFTFQLGAPERVASVATLPEVPNLEERRDFATTGGEAVAVPMRLRNDGPVKVERTAWAGVYTAGGEKAREGHFNTQRWLTARGTPDTSRGELPAGVWTTGGAVYALRHAEAEGLLMWVRQEEQQEVYDEERRKRRKVWVTVAQAVVDLGPPADPQAPQDAVATAP